jgi:hypothetical protein
MGEKIAEYPKRESKIIKGEGLERLVRHLKFLEEEYHYGNPIMVKRTTVIVEGAIDFNEPYFYSCMVPGSSSYVDLPRASGIRKKEISIRLSPSGSSIATSEGFRLTGSEFSKILGFSEAALSWNDGIEMNLDRNLLNLKRVCTHHKSCPLGKKSIVRRALEQIV